MSYFGLHLQTPVDEWDSEVLWAAEQGTPYKVIKFFENWRTKLSQTRPHAYNLEIHV